MRRALLLTTLLLGLTAAPSARACSLCSQFGSGDSLVAVSVLLLAVPVLLNASTLTLGTVAAAQLAHGVAPRRGLLITELVLSVVAGLFDGLFLWSTQPLSQSLPGIPAVVGGALALQAGSAIFSALGLARPDLFLSPIAMAGGGGAALTVRFP